MRTAPEGNVRVGQPQRAEILPQPLTSFVGREDVLAELSDLLDRSRLLTLTGPGGSGKTRLGIELARRVAGRYPDGVRFVALATVREAALMPSSIAAALGLTESGDRSVLEQVREELSGRTLLLVLDNLEQIPDAALVVAELLAAGTGSRFLVTSRSPVRVGGEQEYPVPPLPVPQSRTGPAELVAACPSVALFTQRAAAVAPAFRVDDGNAAALAEITRRLDGLPLAIELAAARVKVLAPTQILARLDSALGLLVGGSRDLPDRQQTLRAAIAWSYDLLGVPARRLLAACSAFRGGAALEDLESVCASALDLGTPVLDAVQELADHSLLRLESAANTPRYSMLETVREFAGERLESLPEARNVRAAHAEVFRRLADRLERPPIWPDAALVDRVDAEHDNLRAALDRLQAQDPAAALRMAARLTTFWSLRGHFAEGRKRLRDLLSLVADDHPARVAGLNAAGWLATDQGDLGEAFRLLDESVGLAGELGDDIGRGTALLNRGRAALGGRGIEVGGWDLDAAVDLLTAAGDEPGAAAASMFAALAPQFSGDLEDACARLSECAQRCEDLGLPILRGRAQQLLGIAYLQRDDPDRARTALGAALPVVIASGDRFGICVGLGGLIGLAARTGRPRLALRLLGVLDAFADANQVASPQPLQVLTDHFLAPCVAAVGAAANKLREDGRRLPIADAVSEVFTEAPDEIWRTGPGPGLTRREAEVAELVADGLSNREIAARLHLSVRTVEVHVDRVLTKLGLHSRTRLAAWAARKSI